MPIIKVNDVAFPTLQAPDLEVQEKFLLDFGMQRTALTEDTLYMHGDGDQNFIHVSKKGEKKFLALAFYADSIEDLETLSQSINFSDVEEMNSPGGGFKTQGIDPNGLNIEVVFGIEEINRDNDLTATGFNVGGKDRSTFQRINKPKRFIKGAYPRIKRFGHIGLNVENPEESLKWYNEYLGIIATDILQPEKGMTFGIFSRCDRGDDPSDHHNIFFLPNMLSEGVSGINHVSYEVVDFDDVFMGHEILQREGYTPEWGIGRHYQGSQVFDYWRSPFGHVHEHQTDGDVFTADVPPNIVNISEDGDPDNPEVGPSQWGFSLPPTFGNKEGV